METLCTICARGGSKGVPNKNSKLLLGKPLIAWTIEEAKKCKEINSVVVSTDCEKIAKIAQDYGALVPFMRPNNLASDNSGKWEVWQNALEECEKIYNKNYDMYIDLDCTSPLKESEDISNAISIFKEKKVDCVFSICESRKNPYFNMVEYQDNKLIISKKLDQKIVCRQNAPKVFDHVAAIYILDTKYLKNSFGLLSGRAIGYNIGIEKGIDIDNEIDFEIVQYLMSKKHAK